MIDISKKSLQVEIENSEFAKAFHYFMTIEIIGDSVKRRTDISAQVTNPIFQTNKFYLPLQQETLKKSPTLLIQSFVVTNRIEQLSDNEIYGQAKLLGSE